MSYDIFRRKSVGGDVARMGADSLEVVRALRNPAVTETQAARALKKGVVRGSFQVGALGLAAGLLLGRYVFPKR